jgi:hypothetical protein
MGSLSSLWFISPQAALHAGPSSPTWDRITRKRVGIG